jgi:hypothetical protein
VGYRGRDRMVVEFTTTYAISAYRHERLSYVFLMPLSTIFHSISGWLVLLLEKTKIPEELF